MVVGVTVVLVYGGGIGSDGGWGKEGGWRWLGGGRVESMVLHMSRRRTRVRFTWETTPVGWLQTCSNTE